MEGTQICGFCPADACLGRDTCCLETREDPGDRVRLARHIPRDHAGYVYEYPPVRRRRDFARGTVDICSYEGRLKGGGSVRILIRRFFPLNTEGINVASVTRLCISIVSCSDLKATLWVIILSVFFTQIHLFGIINQNHLVTLKQMGQWKERVGLEAHAWVLGSLSVRTSSQHLIRGVLIFTAG